MKHVMAPIWAKLPTRLRLAQWKRRLLLMGLMHFYSRRWQSPDRKECGDPRNKSPQLNIYTRQPHPFQNGDVALDSQHEPSFPISTVPHGQQIRWLWVPLLVSFSSQRRCQRWWPKAEKYDERLKLTYKIPTSTNLKYFLWQELSLRQEYGILTTVLSSKKTSSVFAQRKRKGK